MKRRSTGPPPCDGARRTSRRVRLSTKSETKMTLEAQLTQASSRPDRTTLLIYLSALTAMFMAVLDMNIVVTAMPTIAHELGDVGLMGWVGAAYLLSTAAVAPFYGKLGDMYGRKSVVVFAVAAFVAGSLLCGLAWSMPSLIAARVL